MGEYHVDVQDWRRWPKVLIMRRVWSTNGHNCHREVRRYVPDGHAAEVEHKNENLRYMMEYYTDWAHDEVMKARMRESRERDSVDRLRDRVHEIAAERDTLKEENEKLRQLVRDMWHDGMCDCDEFSHSIGVCAKCEYGYLDRLRDLGIEVDG